MGAILNPPKVGQAQAPTPNADYTSVARNYYQQRQATAGSAAANSTIQTSGQGDLTTPVVARKTILG